MNIKKEAQLLINYSLIDFIPLQKEHFILLHQWINLPHVNKWWGDEKSWTFQNIQNKYQDYTLGYKLEGNIKKAILYYKS